jgi:TDG/mug DNA glycosylase family protein
LTDIRRPTREDLEAARGRFLKDVIGPGLRVLFCGINPSLYSAAIGHHFGRPGNRFWPALHAGGFTDRLFSPYEDTSILGLGLGLTNLVRRATAAADELTGAELVTGGQGLLRRVRRHRPAWLGVLGVGAFRVAFRHKDAILGLQTETIGDTKIWVLPSPSGLNAHYRLTQLSKLFAEFRATVDESLPTPRRGNRDSAEAPRTRAWGGGVAGVE